MALSKAERFRVNLLDWSEGNLRSFPWREPDRTPYEVLIAEVLLARTAAEQVEPVYRELLDTYPTYNALADATKGELMPVVQPLGLQSMRAEALDRIGNQLVEHGGVPESEDALLEIPYIGPYTANATLCFGFGMAKPIVDANVARIYARLFGLTPAEMENPEIWECAEEALPDTNVRRFNLALLDFGAALCTPRSPRCNACFARHYCEKYASENRSA